MSNSMFVPAGMHALILPPSNLTKPDCSPPVCHFLYLPPLLTKTQLLTETHRNTVAHTHAHRRRVITYFY